jgi:dihydropteroate synthase
LVLRKELQVEMRVIPLKINNLKEAKRFMASIGTDKEGIKIMSPKSILKAFRIEGLKPFTANIIKQQLLSLGCDAAISRDALLKRKDTDVLIFGTLSQLQRFIKKIKHQPFQLKELASQLKSMLDGQRNRFTFIARDKRLNIKSPLICGIINLTPDSFSGDGIFSQVTSHKSQVTGLVLKKVEGMVKNGAKMIDLGGESSRPFSKPIKDDEEIKRVIPYLKLIRARFPQLILSIDTYKYKVAKAAVNEGIDVINDITALRHSPQIISLIKRYHLGCILMHMKGRPQTMQIKPRYKDVVKEILDFLEERVCFCLNQGIDRNQLMVDPGIGFGKRLEDNLDLISRLYEFKSLGLPIFLGVSRKSFIGNIGGVGVEERLPGTLASVVFSILNGADVVRVHDVREVAQAIKIIQRLGVG